MIKLPQFKCRASQTGVIMTNGRGKDSGMGETAKSYLKEWAISQLTGKQKEIESKYLTHGNYGETFGLERASNFYGLKFNKNLEQLENDFFTGSFDSKDGDIVIDIKCPYDEFTMPYFDVEPPKGYYNQLQVYMDLTGLKKSALVYCLENHSDDEIERLSNRLAYKEAVKLGIDPAEHEMTMEHWNEAKKQLTFDHLPDWMRIRKYEFNRDDKLIDEMKQRVIESRQYINEIVIPELNELKNSFNQINK